VQENNGVFGINTEAYCSGFVEGEDGVPPGR
jgi:hypothetical protein